MPRAGPVGSRLRPSLGGARHVSGLGCKEISLQTQPLFSHAPLTQNQGRLRVNGSLNKVAGLAPAAPVALEAQSHDNGHEEEVCSLCSQCQLPLGDLAYAAVGPDGGPLVHGECKAQLIVQDLQRAEEARLKKDATIKREQRSKYDLGWKVQRVPRNAGQAIKLGCSHLPRGMCGLIWHEESRTVAVVPTVNPAASVNLEYLSLALRSRTRDGREPMFSLDPQVDSSVNKHKLWQVKRFEPQWLDGTSVGEVMFQADYHLKELSMGEHMQPVTGMRSCLDFSEEQGLKEEWRGREWFIVKKAEVQLLEGNLLAPRVQMGVEARETFRGEKGLEDTPLTRPDHPLVKYANDFTHFFDLIAERKSVIHHLRELGKATVLSKFLVEQQVHLGEEWFDLADLSAGPSPHKEIPQLWNEQRISQVQIEDGRIVSTEEGLRSASLMHGVYGGVQMGMDQVARVPVQVGRVPTAKVSIARAPALSQRLLQARPGLAEFALEAPGAAPGVPKGVDLNLDRFDLSTATKPVKASEGSWIGEDFLGRAFWKHLSNPDLPEEDRNLLKAVFCQQLSDRREDCELFVPPDTTVAHVEKLRELVSEEAKARQERKDHFLSLDFAPENPGHHFPAWRPSVSLPPSQVAAVPRVALHPRPECTVEAAALVKLASPSFNKITEDGARFRIYQLSSLEVRTTQQLDEEEIVGAVFSTRSRSFSEGEGRWSTVAQIDHIVKAVLYVEPCAAEGHHFYTVLETDHSDAVVVELQPSGEFAWVESPVNLEARNAKAKVIRAADCGGCGPTVWELRDRLVADARGPSNVAERRRYAQSVLQLVRPERREAPGAWARWWTELSAKERAAAQALGLVDAGAWDAAVWTELRCKGEGHWRFSWVQLNDAQRDAALTLNVSDVWDEAAWAHDMAWARPWAQLSEEERQAANELGIIADSTWDTAFGGPGKRGQGLSGVWEKSWVELEHTHRLAATRLGITGAGAWDKSKAKCSVQRVWAQLTEAERESKMQEWVKQQYGSSMWHKSS